MSEYYVVEYQDTYGGGRYIHYRKDDITLGAGIGAKYSIDRLAEIVGGTVTYRESTNMAGANTFAGDVGFSYQYAPWTKAIIKTSETPLSVPESATIATTAFEDRIAVNWSPHSDGGSAITGYRVILKNETRDQTVITLNFQSTQTSTIFQNLIPDTRYRVYVTVINAIGESFEQSKSATTLGGVYVPPVVIPEPTPEPIPDGFHQMPDGSIMAELLLKNQHFVLTFMPLEIVGMFTQLAILKLQPPKLRNYNKHSMLFFVMPQLYQLKNKFKTFTDLHRYRHKLTQQLILQWFHKV